MLLHQIEALVAVGVVHVVLAVSYHAEQLEQEMLVRVILESTISLNNIIIYLNTNTSQVELLLKIYVLIERLILF